MFTFYKNSSNKNFNGFKKNLPSSIRLALNIPLEGYLVWLPCFYIINNTEIRNLCPQLSVLVSAFLRIHFQNGITGLKGMTLFNAFDTNY